MGMIGKTGDVVIGLVRPELVEEKEGVKMVERRSTYAAAQANAGSIGSVLADYSANGSAKFHIRALLSMAAGGFE
jgi:hypothetical protein